MNTRSWLLIAAVVVSATGVAIALRSTGTDEGAAPTSTTITAPPTTTATSTSATPPSTATTTTAAPAGSTLLPGATACDAYDSITEAGAVATSELFETSGIAASRAAPGVIWAHNDSGADATIYAVGPNGEHLGSFAAGGSLAFDWEDLAVGPGPDPNRAYLYVGDIGDNLGIRAGRVTVYVLPEPDPNALPDVIPVERSIVLDTPDGAHDFESQFVADGAIFLVTKDRESAAVYRSVSLDDASSLELVATLDLGAEVTAADVSWDGSTIAFRGYENVWLWHREPGTSIADALATDPCPAPAPTEPQGEALTFLDDGTMVTVSEGEHPPIHVIPRAA